jgi:predicted MPP superfamily phosphohydrolase
MVVFMILMLAAYLGGNGYICLRGWQALRHFPPAVQWIFGGWVWISALSLLLTFVLRHSRMSASSWAHFFFEYSTGWLVFTLYMVLLLLCCDLFRLFCHAFQHGFVCALALTACLLVYGFLHYRQPSTQVIHLTVDKPLAGAGNTLRVVAVSDLHLGMGTARGQLEKYIRMINDQQPDIILIGGDLIDHSITPVRERRMAQILSQLHAKSGIYMVPGNHEYISGLEECTSYLRETPIHFLRDSAVRLPNGLWIIGRDDYSNRLRKPLPQLTGDLDAVTPLIVLDHQPVELAQAVEAGADLLFCGHTHNGQVWPMNRLTGHLFEIAYGYEKRGNTNIYVSSGLALWGPPFRIGSRSEMVVFNLSFRRP